MNRYTPTSSRLGLLLYGGLSVFTLGLVGCEAQDQKIRELVVQLGERDALVRANAAETLGQIGEPAVPALIEALRDKNPSVRVSVVWKLSEIGKPTDTIVPALIGTLGDEQENVRVATSMALADMGEPTVPYLIQALDHANADVRLHAVYALGEIGEPIDVLIPVFIQRFNDPEWNVRRVSVRALVNIGEPAGPQLTVALESEDAEIRRFASIALSQMELRTR